MSCLLIVTNSYIYCFCETSFPLAPDFFTINIITALTISAFFFLSQEKKCLFGDLMYRSRKMLFGMCIPSVDVKWLF